MKSPIIILNKNCNKTLPTLKRWSRECMGDLKKDSLNLEKRIHDLQLSDVDLRPNGLNSHELNTLSNLINQYNTTHGYLKFGGLSAKIRWLNLGDQNNKYFHRMSSYSNRNNKIPGLDCEEELIVDHNGIKGNIDAYFQNKWGIHPLLHPFTFSFHSFPFLNEEESVAIMLDIIESKITKVVTFIGPNSASRIDRIIK